MKKALLSSLILAGVFALATGVTTAAKRIPPHRKHRKVPRRLRKPQSRKRMK